jgi:hypothetical protein
VDSDGDGVADGCDNCANVFNAGQSDVDGDGVGDLCDNCQLTSNGGQSDVDSDGVGDVCDNCPGEANATQDDSDGDGTGDACETIPCAAPSNGTATCDSIIGGSLDTAGANDMAGAYSCGDPYSPIDQNGPEDVYVYVCTSTGLVTFDFDVITCDLDAYVLDATCDALAGCLQGNTAVAAASPHTLSFDCVAGETKYIIIEGWGVDQYGCSNAEYTLDFDIHNNPC